MRQIYCGDIQAAKLRGEGRRVAPKGGLKEGLNEKFGLAGLNIRDEQFSRPLAIAFADGRVNRAMVGMDIELGPVILEKIDQPSASIEHPDDDSLDFVVSRHCGELLVELRISLQESFNRLCVQLGRLSAF